VTNPQPLRTASFSLMIVLIVALGIFGLSSHSEARIGQADAIWNDVAESALAASTGTRVIVPDRYRTVALNLAALQSLLSHAPMERSAEAQGGGRIEVSLPMPDGRMARFLAEESPIMEAPLAARYPDIKTYRAQGIDDPSATARFGLTPAGFHAIVLSPLGAYYIDPYRRGDAVNHLSYFKSDLERTDAHRFECEVLLPNGQKAPSLSAESASTVVANRSNGAQLRTYRLALAADFEYSDFHSDAAPVPDKAQVLANGIVPTVNRVVGIYEREVSVHMNLVANEDLIIFNTPADPYVDNNGTQMLAANQATCDGVIGPLNYDIGHVVSTGGGGVAFLGVICSPQKAGGVTGLPSPTGDAFYVDYVAHEMGHQFGGNHTFNGTTGSCAGSNREAATAYEPGSGSTIQAYAGICTGQDLQLNSDAYFHTVSYDEILNHIESDGGTCAVLTPTGNTAPTIEAGASYNVPKLTPFTLTAVASDPDGHPLTYNWEEFDLGAANDGKTDNGSSPIFRSYNATTSPSRTFPSLQYILNNANTPPSTFPCGIGGTRTCLTGEVLPNTTRMMTFRATARDNRAGGGGVDYDSMQVNVKATAGPFVITFPSGGETWSAGQTQTITWNVANTDVAPISAANVDIHLSTDGGQTFPILLATGVTNDGSQDVTVPAVSTIQARVRVSASGNIFFDISNANLKIDAISPPVALDDAATTGFQTPILIPVLANDSDPGGFTLSIVGVQSPTTAGGTAAVNDNGTPSNTADDRILYTPPPQFSGADNFTYRISNGSSTATAIVGVTIDPFCLPTATGGFLADFEGVPPSPDGFTVQTPTNAPQSAPWTIVADPGAHSASNSYFTDNANVNGAQKRDRLISPPQLISSTSRLIFWHRFSLEPDFDGGILEVSINGGASYADITSISAGNEFISGGYSQTMGNGPLTGRAAWTGRSSGFLTSTMNKVEVDLSALVGKSVIFRWYFVADDLNLDEAVGWWVDDIQFTNLLVKPPCNEPPFAVSFATSTNEDTPVGITFIVNQGDDFDSLNYTIESQPAHGTLTPSPPTFPAGVTYTPNANYHGGDSFTYRAYDGTYESNVATVTITVRPVNDPPTAGDDAATVSQGSGPNQIDVLRNDSSLPDGGEALSIQSVTQGTHGAVAIINDGASLTYDPDNGYSGSDSFTYVLSDGNGGTAVANVAITIDSVAVRTNYALAGNGGAVLASSTHPSNLFPALSVINGNRTGATWGTSSGGWNDGTRNAYPDILEIVLPGVSGKTIDEINVFTLQNNWTTAGEPTLLSPATGEGILDFIVQYCSANCSSAPTWTTVAGGDVTGNDKAWRQFSFSPVTTTRIRVVVNNSRNNWSRIVELEAVGARGQ
jgi:reprolysin-like metallo-peptidase family M12B/Big-like domain-containing protein